ncbi:MAG: hypothetical protein QOJ62_69 [Actinomycetota bacterium]|nr:hypothetical protein [Actinomycetota bacterium]
MQGLTANRFMPPRTRLAGTGLACIALSFAVAACGGAKSQTAAATTPTTAASSAPAPASASASGTASAAQRAAGLAAYSACLQQHGVTLPSGRPSGRPSGNGSAPPSGGPGGGPGGFGGLNSADPSTAAAQQACASLRPQGGFGGGGAGGTISAATFAAFKSCMSDKGVTVTVTDPQQALRSLDRNDAKTAAALKVCQPIIAQAQAAARPSASASPTG